MCRVTGQLQHCAWEAKTTDILTAVENLEPCYQNFHYHCLEYGEPQRFLRVVVKKMCPLSLPRLSSRTQTTV